MEDYEDFGPEDDDQHGEPVEPVEPVEPGSGRYSDPDETHLHPDFANHREDV